MFALDVVEPVDAQPEFTHHEQCPPVADHAQRICDPPCCLSFRRSCRTMALSRKEAVVVTDVPRVGAPAARALESAGYRTLESLAGTATAALLALHGLGPRAVRIIGEALADAKLPPLQ